MLRKLGGLVAAAVLVAAAPVASTLGGEKTATSAPGFTDEVVLSGLQEPLAVAFARDGRVFVAEKRGRGLGGSLHRFRYTGED